VDTNTIRILLVEDDLGDVEMTRALLSQAGEGVFALDWVSSFEEALDAFEREEYHAYIVDYFLEDRTGLDLLREAGRRGVRAPVIMLTGRGSPVVDKEAMAEGAADYLVKGQFGPEELERSIRHALQRAKGSGPPEGADPVDMGQARFRAVFETSHTGIALVDVDDLLLEVNGAFARFLGSTPEAMTGLPLSGLLEREDLPTALREQGALVRGEEERTRTERRFRREDGSTARSWTTTTLIRNSSGEPDHLVVVLETAQEAV
jgi:PAS domain S-box-containing protein